jgi:hypothetical protein
MANYIFNLETTKIELHFAKSDYDALTGKQKDELKHAFLWSNYGKCWVSRAKEPHLWSAKQVAASLGFTEEEREGERLSFSDQIERKAERAEERADRYEEYAGKAEGRAAVLQKPINDMHGDIAFFTQPIIAGHAGSQAFKNRRDRMFAQYDKGFEEYRKSEYFRGRADIARDTASGEKYKDKAFLDRRIKEVRTEIRKRDANITGYECTLYALENGEQKTKYNGEPYAAEEVSGWIERELELIQVAQDKEGYFLNCLDALGGVAFSPDNIAVGDIVHVQRWGECEIVSTGRVNVIFRILHGGASGGTLKAAYAEILEIISKSEKKKERHPFTEGETYTFNVWNGKHCEAKAYKIIKATDSTIQLQTDGGRPVLRKPSKSLYRPNTWQFTMDGCFNGTIYKAANA